MGGACATVEGATAPIPVTVSESLKIGEEPLSPGKLNVEFGKEISMLQVKDLNQTSDEKSVFFSCMKATASPDPNPTLQTNVDSHPDHYNPYPSQIS